MYMKMCAYFTGNSISFNERPPGKTNTTSMSPAKTQTSPGAHPVRSESSLCTRIPRANSEDPDLAWRTPSPIPVLAGHKAQSVGSATARGSILLDFSMLASPCNINPLHQFYLVNPGLASICIVSYFDP